MPARLPKWLPLQLTRLLVCHSSFEDVYGEYRESDLTKKMLYYWEVIRHRS